MEKIEMHSQDPQNSDLSEPTSQSSLYSCIPQTPPPPCIPSSSNASFSSRGQQKIFRSVRNNSESEINEVCYFESVSLNDFDSLQRKYGELNGEIIVVDITPSINYDENGVINKPPNLGICLCGCKDQNQMAVIVCGLKPYSLIQSDGRILVGDQLLELNEHILYGRSHLNAGPIIRSSYLASIAQISSNFRKKPFTGALLRFVIHRCMDNFVNMAVAPMNFKLTPKKSIRINSSETVIPTRNISTTEPISLNANNRSIFEVLYATRILKGKNGFGFALMDGSFAGEQGNYIQQVLPNSPAAGDGVLRAGDRIVRIDWHDALNANYRSVLKWIRSAKHQIDIVVSRVHLSLDYANKPSEKDLYYSKRLSVPIFSSFFMSKLSGRQLLHGEMLVHPSKNRNKKVDDDHQHDLNTVDIRRASSPEEFAPGFAKRAAAKKYLGLFSMPSMNTITKHLISANLTEPTILSTNLQNDNKSNHASKTSSDDHPTICSEIISPGLQTKIKIQKRNACSLGITLIGGSETSLGVLQIHEIFPGGAVALDGRLQPGDRIIAINDQLLGHLSFQTAVATITKVYSGFLPITDNVDLATIASDPTTCSYPISSSCVYFTVERPSGVQTQWYDQEVLVELTKKPAKGLGLGIVERAGVVTMAEVSSDKMSNKSTQQINQSDCSSLGVIVSDIIKGSEAWIDGRILLGDQILSINNTNVQTSSQKEVAKILTAAQGKVELRLGRLKNQCRLPTLATAFINSY